MKNTPATRRLRAKTGTLRGVSALSGAVARPSGDVVAFSILTAGYKTGAGPMWRVQNALGAALASDGLYDPDAKDDVDEAEQVLADAGVRVPPLDNSGQVAVAAEAGLTLAEVDAVVVGCGPGPFTGLRVGMATAAAFGHALEVPVHGVCSLDAIGNQTSGEVLVVTDARRREVYWARYRDGVRVDGPDVAAAVDVTLLGRFYERFADHAVEISRRVIFQVTGRLPEDEDVATY
jgi:hypothetical protein